MSENSFGIDEITKILCLATKKILEKGTGKQVVYSKTVQKIPKISLRPELGCFVQFSGDYNGLLVGNFSSDAAMDLYRNYMLTMGLPESELTSNATSNEVVDTIGELTNQIMGRAMQMAETKYDLTAKFGQPKAVALNSPIILTLENTTEGSRSSETESNDNRRIVFKVGSNRFQLEIAMEKTEFISMA